MGMKVMIILVKLDFWMLLMFKKQLRGSLFYHSRYSLPHQSKEVKIYGTPLFSKLQYIVGMKHTN